MKVLYDYQAFGESYTTGVSRCFVELIKRLPSDVEYEILLKENSNLYIKESGIASNATPATLNMNTFLKGVDIIPVLWRNRLYRKLRYLYPLIKTTEAKNLHYSIKKMKKGEYDIFHPTLIFNDYFLKYLHGKPWVMTVHDMVSEKIHGVRNFQSIAKRNLIFKADAIVAISENTKKDIVDILKVPQERIVVIPHGSQEPINVGDKRIVSPPYFLYVGMRSGYKNFQQTLIDFSIFSALHPEVKLVCTWKEFNSEELKLINSLNINERIIHIYASEQELANLYENAIAFIYPSVYEGFGLPILEAYAYNCMCLLNDASCFPEVGGEGAVYFDSKEGKSNLPQKMELVYSMSEQDKIPYFVNQKKIRTFYTWEKSAKKMVELYKSLL